MNFFSTFRFVVPSFISWTRLENRPRTFLPFQWKRLGQSGFLYSQITYGLPANDERQANFLLLRGTSFVTGAAARYNPQSCEKAIPKTPKLRRVLYRHQFLLSSWRRVGHRAPKDSATSKLWLGMSGTFPPYSIHGFTAAVDFCGKCIFLGLKACLFILKNGIVWRALNGFQIIEFLEFS